MTGRAIDLLALGLALLTASAVPAGGQERQTGPLAQRQAQAPARREQLAQQLRRRLWSVTKDRVGLSDAQMTRLGETSSRFDARRRSLNQQERAQRVVLRGQILAGDKADQSRVSAALEQLQQLQRQRLDLQGQEQQEFASFMTPLQRAKYAALQEQVRRRVEALRRQRPDSSGLGTP
ncbi:MAG: hypothetical protein ACHQRK_04670 [Gemmatimonadales bacterium]